MQEVYSSQSGDGVDALLVGLADRLRSDLADVAVVERTELPDAQAIGWDLRPANPRSAPVSWLLFSDEIVLQVGKLDRGGRWELARSIEDASFVERVIRAAIAGRVTEVSALARSRVEVTLENGKPVHETGYEGCRALLLPLPGWRRWGRAVTYEPYDVLHGEGIGRS